MISKFFTTLLFGNTGSVPVFRADQPKEPRKIPFDKNNPFHVMAKAVHQNDTAKLEGLCPFFLEMATKHAELIQF